MGEDQPRFQARLFQGRRSQVGAISWRDAPLSPPKPNRSHRCARVKARRAPFHSLMTSSISRQTHHQVNARYARRPRVRASRRRCAERSNRDSARVRRALRAQPQRSPPAPLPRQVSTDARRTEETAERQPLDPRVAATPPTAPQAASFGSRAQVSAGARRARPHPPPRFARFRGARPHHRPRRQAAPSPLEWRDDIPHSADCPRNQACIQPRARGHLPRCARSAVRPSAKRPRRPP